MPPAASTVPSPGTTPAPPAGARTPVSRLVQDRLDGIADFYNTQPTQLNRYSRGYRELLARHYRYLIPPTASVLEIGCGGGDLLALLPNEDVAGVDVSAVQIERARTRVPHGQFRVSAGETLEAAGRAYDFVILSETLNFAADVQSLLQQVHAVSRPATRLLCNFYSSLWRPVLAAATSLGLKTRAPQSNWLSTADMRNLCELADWQMVKTTSRLLCPIPVPGLATLLNRWFAPWLPWACMTVFGVARPRGHSPGQGRSVSVIVPARNESGNIEHAVRRIPAMGTHTELLFIEGHSTDDTWEAIQRAVAAHPDLDIKALRQSGRGKGNAVREAFAAARGDILMILDADLTMPPEDLPRFYDALAQGHAEFANGVRLVLSHGKARHAVPEPLREQGVQHHLQLAARPARQGHALRHQGASACRLREDRRQPGVLRGFRPIRGFRPAFWGGQARASRLPTFPSTTASAPTARRTSTAGATAGCCCAWCSSPHASSSSSDFPRSCHSPSRRACGDSSFAPIAFRSGTCARPPGPAVWPCRLPTGSST